MHGGYGFDGDGTVWVSLCGPSGVRAGYLLSVSRALLRARSLSRSLRWLRRDSVPVSVSSPSRLLTALALKNKPNQITLPGRTMEHTHT